MGSCKLGSARPIALGGQRKAHELHSRLPGQQCQTLSFFYAHSYTKQDTETGGFADRPGDLPDPFHTLFGVAGLGLLGEERGKKV